MTQLSTQKWIKWVKYLTNGLMGYTTLILAITLYQRYDAWRIGGACPVPLQRIWTYTAIASAATALILILVVERWQKNQKNHVEQAEQAEQAEQLKEDQ